MAYEVSYSTHILQTCSSALHDLQTSRRRRGRLKAAREVPQRQQTSEFGMPTQYIHADRGNLRADIEANAREYARREQLLERTTTGEAPTARERVGSLIPAVLKATVTQQPPGGGCMRGWLRECNHDGTTAARSEGGATRAGSAGRSDAHGRCTAGAGAAAATAATAT